jgi:hypothetical protein
MRSIANKQIIFLRRQFLAAHFIHKDGLKTVKTVNGDYTKESVDWRPKRSAMDELWAGGLFAIALGSG